MNYMTEQPCGACEGEGAFYADSDKCKKCKGKKTKAEHKKLELKIPKGCRYVGCSN